MAANLTDCLSRTRSPLFLRTPPASAAGRSWTCHPGLGPQPDQLAPLGLAQRGIRVLPGLRGSSCHLHPLAQSHLMDADVTGDLSDRTATVNDESYRLLLVLPRKCAACRTHFSLSRRIGQLNRVSTEAGTVQQLPFPPLRALLRHSARRRSSTSTSAPPLVIICWHPPAWR